VLGGEGLGHRLGDGEEQPGGADRAAFEFLVGPAGARAARLISAGSEPAVAKVEDEWTSRCLVQAQGQLHGAGWRERGEDGVESAGADQLQPRRQGGPLPEAEAVGKDKVAEDRSPARRAAARVIVGDRGGSRGGWIGNGADGRAPRRDRRPAERSAAPLSSGEHIDIPAVVRQVASERGHPLRRGADGGREPVGDQQETPG